MWRAYFNMVPRTITPKRLRPPRPTTIALSDEEVLLKEHSSMLWLSNQRVITTNRYEKNTIKNLNCHLFSSKNFSTPPTQSAHLFPTYSFLLLFWEAVLWRDGNLYRIFPCITSNVRVFIKKRIKRGKISLLTETKIHYILYEWRKVYYLRAVINTRYTT